MDDGCGYCGTFLLKDVATGGAVDIREKEGIDDGFAVVGGIDFATDLDGADCLFPALWTSTTSSLPFLLVVVVEDVKLINAIPNAPLFTFVDASLASTFFNDGPFVDAVFLLVETCKGVDRSSFNNEFNSVRSPPPLLLGLSV